MEMNDKGSNGMVINGKVQFLIETKKVPNAPEWLFQTAKRFGFSKSDCKYILPNNPDYKVHHLCHAWAAYAQSGFNDAAILVIDGMDRPNGRAIGIYSAKNDKIEEVRVYPYAYSLGTWYAFGVSLCGWGEKDYAGRLMGLSSYADNIGNPDPFFLVDNRTGDIIENSGIFYTVSEKNESGNFLANFSNEKYIESLIAPNESHTDTFSFRYANLAGKIQYIFEQAVFSLLDYMHNILPSRNLIITGGCGLNCVCNGKIIRSGKWDNLFIPNMCEDSGNIIGRMAMEYNQNSHKPYIYNKVTYPVPKSYNRIISKEEIAEKLKNGTVIAWFEGGSEYGPRALCHRSLLADPTLKKTAYRLNEIKHREYWRPLAPVVLDSAFKTFFDVPGKIWAPHKTMLSTEYIRQEYQRKLPAVCAPDNSSRPQVLIDNPYNHTLYSLMKESNLPILVNTSMNDNGMPICETPQVARNFCEKYPDVLLVFVKNDTIYTRDK